MGTRFVFHGWASTLKWKFFIDFITPQQCAVFRVCGGYMHRTSVPIQQAVHL